MTVIGKARSLLRTYLRIRILSVLERIGYTPPPWVRADVPRSGWGYYPSGTIHDICTFVINQAIEGDVLEFGIGTGASFITYCQYYEALRRDDEANNDSRMNKMRATRFFAFDSFEGLPSPSHALDIESGHFAAGDYATSLEQFRLNVERSGVDSSRVICVPGYYKDTLTPDRATQLDLSQASIVSIDCDLYESTVSVLAYVEPLLCTGTVLVFNDWVDNLHSPRLGEQRAFHEWRLHHPELRFSRFIGATGWNFTAFIVHRNPDYWPEDLGQIAL